MKYKLCIVPNDEVKELANSYRMRYDPFYASIPPHVTLKDSFADEDLDEGIQPILEKISEVTTAYPSFDVLFNKVLTFYPTNPVVYFAIDDHKEVKELHSLLKPIFENLPKSRFKFVPHLTIGQAMPTSELLDIYGSLRMNRYEVKHAVHEIHLLAQDDTRVWKIFHTFPLKANG